MAKQTFKTPLNFQQVSVGSLEDKVLMRTADGDIKELPSDSFGGGGSSQDLQAVVETGGKVSFDTNRVYFKIFNFDDLEALEYFARSATASDNFTRLYFNPENIALEQNHESRQASNTIGIEKGVILLRQSSLMGQGGATHLVFKEPLGFQEVTIQIPAKVRRFEADGVTEKPYDLATLDDIAVTKDALNNTITWNSILASNSSLVIGRSGGNYRINLQAGNDNVFVNNTGIDIKATSNLGTSFVRLLAPMPSGNNGITYNFPKTTTGDYNIATEDSINLQKALNNGSSATVNTPIFIQNNGESGATSSINFVPGGTMSTTAGLALYTDNSLDLTGSGFNLVSSIGQGKISSNGNSQLVINSESGKLFLKGGAQGVDLDGQGGAVNIDSFYGVKINSKNAITAINGEEADEYGELTLSLAPMVTANTAPSSATDTGVRGDIRIDANYIYLCVAPNTWKRSPLSTW